MAVILYLKVKYIWEKYFFYKSNWEGSTLISNLYINLAWVSVCLFWCLSVCLYPINVKTAEPIGPKFFVGHLGPQGRFMNDWNFKNLCLKVFYFCKILKMREKILWNPQTFFVFVLYCTKRRCSQIKPQ